MYQDNLPLSLPEMIVTSSYDRVFPPGYRVGRLEQRDNGTVQVRPCVSWNKLEFVQAITSYPEPQPAFQRPD